VNTSRLLPYYCSIEGKQVDFITTRLKSTIIRIRESATGIARRDNNNNHIEHDENDDDDDDDDVILDAYSFVDGGNHDGIVSIHIYWR
jgi:hypothetical protein